LIEGLLDISKIEAGHLTIHRDTINLGEFLEQLVDMFRLQANAKGLTFLFEPQGTLPEYVHGDEKRLRQVLINLLSNAIKYTDHGSVTLSVSYRTMIAQFSVHDSGVGIDRRDLERIFIPFERVAAPKCDARPGTGLGLTITKLLTEVMGGEIAVNSTPGVGSQFTIRLLLSQTTTPQRVEKTLPIRGFTDRRRRIIVVDDDPSHRHLMRDLLTPVGFDVYPVPGGSECLLLYETVKPDAFLLDISMPSISGWELAKRLRESGSNAAIIMISANVDEQRHKVPNQAEPVYHDAYLVKPLRLQELLVRLQELLKLQSVTDTAGIKLPERDANPFADDSVPDQSELSVLHQLSRVGYVRGIQTKLDDIEQRDPRTGPFVMHLRKLVKEYDLKRCEYLLETLIHAHS
ncbi:MAG: ATP-binding protein, partial [Candidatus Competibacteraceae bacterium]|nr:ATP-binding protein [Candidatus Competibacteraceae bacterium]